MGYCIHICKLELQYWEEDGMVSNVTDEIIISLADETDNTSTESNISEDKSNDSVLAQPLPT
jgi:hypothetical protein